MEKRPGNTKLGPRLHLHYLTCLVFCLYFLVNSPASVDSLSPPIAGDRPAAQGLSSLNIRPKNSNSSPSTPLVSLLVSATSSSSASVPTSLAASSSTLGLLASSTDQELENETSNDHLVTKLQPPDTTIVASGVQDKGEVLPGSVPKSGSDRITVDKRQPKCLNGTGQCENSASRSSLNENPKKTQAIAAAIAKEVTEEWTTTSGPNPDKSTLQPPTTIKEKFLSSSMAPSTTTTTGTPTAIEITTTTQQPPRTAIFSTTTTGAVPKTTVKKGTKAVPTTPIPSSSPTPRDYIYGNQADLSDYSEYSDARFAEERRRDQNASSVFRDHSRDIGDDLDLYDMERDINPTEGAAFERTRLNRNMSAGTGILGNPSRENLQTNLTGKNNLTNKQIFFPEHYPLRKMKHRTWFAQQHRLGRHELDPIDDGPFSSLIWKDKKYLISVLVPIGVGIAGAVVFVVAAYATRSCRGAPQTFIPTVGTDLFLQHVHSRNDDIFLLMETTDDEM